MNRQNGAETGLAGAPEENDIENDVELVGLERADPEADPAELSLSAGTEPAMDSPGDDAILEQEELLEGMSSEAMPSRKLENGAKRMGSA